MNFYIGTYNGSGLQYDDEESFIKAIRRFIKEYDDAGANYFEVIIEPIVTKEMTNE